MAERTLRIVQLSTYDIGGGAERVAWNLFQSYRTRGHRLWLAVGCKRSSDPDVLRISNSEARSGWSRVCWSLYSHLQLLDEYIRLSHLAHQLAEPRAWLDSYRGIEDFHFPGTWRLLQMTPQPPDIVHCHNLHGGYFDLQALPWLSQQVPTFMTLHDAWLLSGHCAHSFDCERWKIGCGECPDLTIYPAVRRDATAYNWQRKREIFARSRLYVATPSRWLMRKVQQSILAPAIVEARVIPNGVDLRVFHPSDRQAIRETLGIPRDTKVLLFTANDIRKNVWKDYPTMLVVLARVAERLKGQSVLFIGLGEDAPGAQIGQASIRFVPYQRDPAAVACYYQAADVYVHAARADTFPNTILEALACGIPVVATAVGGIPEQVKALQAVNNPTNWSRLDEATGFLVPPSDAEAMAGSIERLLKDGHLRQRLEENAAIDARGRFDLERQVEEYLNWYGEILARSNAEPVSLVAKAK